MLSRIFAYDALGSYALAALGIEVARPLAASFGVGPVLVRCGAVVVVLTVLAQSVPEVRHRLRAVAPGPC